MGIKQFLETLVSVASVNSGSHIMKHVYLSTAKLQQYVNMVLVFKISVKTNHVSLAKAFVELYF